MVCSRLALGLGNKITDESLHTNRYGGSASSSPIRQLSVPMLTDHPLFPHATANTTFYNSGFVIDKLDETHCHPLCISFALHVDRVWIVDVREVMSACVSLYLKHFRGAAAGSGPGSKNALEASMTHLSQLDIDGLLVVFRLRDMHYCKQARQSLAKGGPTEGNYTAQEQDYLELLSALQSNFAEDADNHDFREAFLHPPLASNLPFMGSVGAGTPGFGRYIALFFSSITSSSSSYTLSPNSVFSSSSNSSASASRSSTTILTSVLGVWKRSLRGLAIPCYVGCGDITLPDEILSAFLSSLDIWKTVSLAPESVDMFGAGRFSDSEPSSSLYSARDLVREYLRAGLLSTASVQVPALGYEQMSAHHLLAEAFHLGSSRTNRAIGGAEADRSSGSSSSDSSSVILLSSAGGAGVYNLATQLRERMLARAKQAGATGLRVRVMCLDFNRARHQIAQRTGSDPRVDAVVEELAAQLCASSRTAFKEASGAPSVVLVCLTGAATAHVSTHSILHLLNIASRSTIRMSIAVMSDAAVPTSSADAVTTGEEFYRAQALEMCSALNCNCVVAVTAGAGSSSGYSSLRQWLEANNPQATLIKVTGTNMWIQEDQIAQIFAAVPCLAEDETLMPDWNGVAKLLHGISNRCAYTASEALFTRILQQAMRGSLQTTQCGVRCLQSVPFCAKEAIWDIVSLVNVLRLMFPAAIVSNTVVSEVWNAQCLQNDPKSQKMACFAKARLLATIKIMCRRQVQLSRDDNKAAASKHGSTARALRCGQVYGVVRIKAGGWDLNGEAASKHSASNHSTFAIVDANHSTIIIRPQLVDLTDLLDPSSDGPKATTRVGESSSMFRNNYNNSLYATGCFAADGSETAVLQELLGSCLLKPLPLAPLMSASEASALVRSREQYNPYLPSKEYEQLLKIQAKYGPALALPSGCLFDGEFYLDFHGNRTNMRPDVDKLVTMHMDNVNRNAQKYNEMVTLVESFM